MFCSADQSLGFEEGAGSPFGVPFRTWYDTQTVFYKGENCRCCFKVVAGEIRPVQFSLYSTGWENVFLFKLNPSESNHFLFSLFNSIRH